MLGSVQMQIKRDPSAQVLTGVRTIEKNSGNQVTKWNKQQKFI